MHRSLAKLSPLCPAPASLQTPLHLFAGTRSCSAAIAPVPSTGDVPELRHPLLPAGEPSSLGLCISHRPRAPSDTQGHLALPGDRK